MDYREMMSRAPKELRPTIVDNKADFLKTKKALAKKLGKKVSELTEAETQEARETFMAANGLTDLDMMIP